jgi:hypothetical protein
LKGEINKRERKDTGFSGERRMKEKGIVFFEMENGECITKE